MKTDEELAAYRHVMQVAHRIIREAFSREVITPGKTTAPDIVWWLRQRFAELGLGSWFHPSITIWRAGAKVAAIPSTAILPGDMLHTDFGIVYLGFCTDTQHNAYLLKPGETDAPPGLKAGLAAANRLQDLTLKAARIGRTGNQALAETLAAATLWDGPVLTLPSIQPGEMRHLALGRIEERHWTVVYAPRGDTLRLISARRSRPDEKKLFLHHLG